MNPNVNASLHRRRVGLMIACLVIACDRSFAEPHYSGLPRTVWAEKLPEGPIKILFVAPYIALHDSHELMQRFDIEGDHVATTHSSNRDPNQFGFEGHYWPELLPTSEQVLDKVREALGGDWEALALGTMPVWSKWPQDIRESVISAVAAGKSLITVFDGPIEKDFAKAGQLQEIQIEAERFPMDDLPGRPRLFRYGRGYVLDFRVKGSATMSQLIQNTFVPSDYEYSAGRAGWYLRLAARPQTPAAIQSVTFSEGKLIVKVAPHRSTAGSTLHVTVRRRESFEIPESFQQYVFETSKQIKPGATVTFTTPQLPGGQYHAEFRATNSQGQTLDWDGLQFYLVGSVDLKSVRLNGKTVEAGQPLTCNLDTEGPTEGLRITARWYDRWNRLLDEKSFETFTDHFTVTAPSSSLSVLNYAQVTLNSSRGPEAVAVAEVLMTENVRPANDFHVLCWPGTDGNQYFQIDALRRHCKVDAISNCGTSEGTARNAAFYHLRTVPYTASIRGPFRRFLVPEDTDHWLARSEEAVRKTAQAHKRYNTLAYTLGDENFVDPFRAESRFVDDPLAWKKFGKFLRERYPDMESLNTQ